MQMGHPISLPMSPGKMLHRVRKVIGQSNLLIVSDRFEAIGAAISSVLYHRAMLENYAQQHPTFLLSLDPVPISETAPRIVRLAAYAAETAGVGPMAAIPGALAELAVENMLLHRASASLVENGGEISAVSNIPFNVGVYAGSSPLSGRIGFHLTSDDFPIGIATSSATVSHAINFGEADAAVVIADTASMADAAAKAVCNAVRGRDLEASVQLGLEKAETIPCVRSALIIRGKYVGTVGKLPKLLKLNGDVGQLFASSLYDIAPQEFIIL